MNVVSGTTLFVLVLVVTLAPRRWALLAMMAGVFFLTQGHSVDVAGLNIYPFRIIEAAAFGRVLLRGELTQSKLNRIDWLLLLAYSYSALMWILRSSEHSPQQIASALDPALCYLALRALIESVDDLHWFLYAFVALLVPFTALVLVERLTGRSAFALVGGNWELYVRNGVARCQGSFRHAILLGSAAASFLALYVGLWMADTRRALAGLGGMLCLFLVALSNSGGPATSAAAVALGWSVWPLRRRMRGVRVASLGILLLLLVFMKAPIWYLPYKISAIVGGGGYHRGLLMDQAWQDLGRWWLAGMDIRDTAEWIPYVHSVVGGADVTNQFVVFALRGGLLALALAIAVFSLAFMGLGKALEATRRSDAPGRGGELLLWGLGVAIFSHAVSWMGVSYFDQSNAVWLMQLAALSSAVQALTSADDRRTAAASTRRPRSRLRIDTSVGGEALASAKTNDFRRSGRRPLRRPALGHRRDDSDTSTGTR